MTTPQSLLEKVSPRAGPLIITVFGDTIAPRGGTIWLGDLIKLMAPLGLSERLVRTGVYRLSREGWLKAHQNGRRSSYSITSTGIDTFADADRRIYAATARTWDGKWVSVQTMPHADTKARKKLRNILTWHGFGQLSPTMMIKPGSNTKIAKQTLQSLDLTSAAIIFTSDLAQQSSQQTIVTNGWNLEDISKSYSHLLNCFGDAERHIKNPESAFVIRSLIIHQYRRILLKDPQLPSQLLPSNWNGEKARRLVARTYRTLTPPADKFITEVLHRDSQKPTLPNRAYGSRFKIEK